MTVAAAPRGRRAWLARVATAVLLFAGAAAARADGPDSGPRYLLSAGREFAFHNEARSEQKGGERIYKVDWKVWSIGRDADGAWKLVLRCDLTMPRDTPGNPEKDEVDTLVWRCRMFDDGRLVGATTMGTVRDPFRLFPRLPDGREEKERGWTSEGPEGKAVLLRHRLKSEDDATLSIETKGEGPMDRVYLETHESRANFDVRRGVVTRVETVDGSGYGSPSVTRGTIELVSVEERGPEWAATFGREADRYFDAVESYDAATTRAVRDAARCTAILSEARAKLEEARGDLTAPVFLDAIDQRLTGHDGTVKYRLERARERASRLGKPAGEWEATDLDGKAHRSEDYRGKIVVMDFWYRGCGWCMHAMPQVNRLAETFRGEPVAVLGMTTDKDEKDARVVVDAMGLKYPTLKAAGIPEKFGVHAYPTLIVIDQAGQIREIHIGYSPRLYEELSGLIRELLVEKPAE